LPFLAFLAGLEEPERSAKWAVLERHEKEATKRAVLKEGSRELLAYLRERGIRAALVTNNSRRNVDVLIRKFGLEFDLVLSREAGLWKPSGAPFIYVMKAFEARKNECCVVGDSRFDIQAAEEAGIPAVFILDDSGRGDLPRGVIPVSSLWEVKERIERFA